MIATLNGIRLAWDDQGQGMPVVLLHGFPFTRWMWRPQVAALARGHRVITPDFRGFGESGGLPERVELLADDVHALVEHLSLSRFALGGFSMGGYVAFRYLARHADRLSGLMLLDTRPEPDTDEGRQRRYAGIDRIRAEGPGGWLEDFLKLVVSPRTLEARPETVAEVRRLMEDARPDALASGLRAMAERPDSTALLSSVTVPTLVLVGEDDKATPVESSRKMATAIPGADLVIIPGAGHMTNVEQSDAFNAAITMFLRRIR
jgi:pimeloyl-ACP methyl ester carboxylesterase